MHRWKLTINAGQGFGHVGAELLPGGDDAVFEGIVVAVFDLAALVEPGDRAADAIHPGNGVLEIQVGDGGIVEQRRDITFFDRRCYKGGNRDQNCEITIA